MRAIALSCLFPLIACSSVDDGASGGGIDTEAMDADAGESGGSETGTGSDTDTDTGTDTGEPAGCLGMGLGPGDHDGQVQHEGQTRAFQIHVPPGYDGSPTPMIVNFHGWTSNAGQQRFFSDMDVHSDAEGYIAVYPDALRNANNDTAWNAGQCCADDDRDDVGFTVAMLDALDQTLCIDPKRIYATGMSNGGFMTYRLACELSEIFAAGAPVAGALSLPVSQCQPTRPVPLLAIHGTADPTVQYSDGAASAEFWRTMNGCDATTTVTLQNGVATCEAYDGCLEGGEVVLCTAEGVGHCWPGQPFCITGTSTEDMESNDEMWAFFSGSPLAVDPDRVV